MKIEVGMHIYYEDCFGFQHDGVVIHIDNDSLHFSVSDNPNTSMPQMDDSYRKLSIKDEGKLFWFYPVPSHPISIEEQMAMK